MTHINTTHLCFTIIAGLWISRCATICALAEILRPTMRKHHEGRTQQGGGTARKRSEATVASRLRRNGASAVVGSCRSAHITGPSGAV